MLTHHAAVAQGLHFTKGHGTGNDFVLFADPEARVDFGADLAKALANRRYGIGSDGVIRAVLSANLPETSILGDSFSPNVIIASGHDGKRAVQIFVTPIRVACSNQLNLALRSATRKWFFPHFGTVTKKMNDAKRTFQLTAQFMDELEWEAETLAAAKLGRSDLRQFIEKMFPVVDSDSDRKTERIKQEIERFHDCYVADDLDNFTGTKWGLLLAVSDFVTHKPLRTVRQRETHLSKMLEGHALLDRAYSLILSL